MSHCKKIRCDGKMTSRLEDNLKKMREASMAWKRKSDDENSEMIARDLLLKLLSNSGVSQLRFVHLKTTYKCQVSSALCYSLKDELLYRHFSKKLDGDPCSLEVSNSRIFCK